MAPAGRASRVTTPLKVEELDVLLDVVVVDDPLLLDDADLLKDPDVPELPEEDDPAVDDEGVG